MKKIIIFIFSLSPFGLVYAQAEFITEGYFAVDGRIFSEKALFDQQEDGGAAIVIRPEFYFYPGNSDHALSFIPFYRLDGQDDKRSHFDVRELMWSNMNGSLSWKVGVGTVFWGVTESQHLVDVVNQVDLLEDPALEKKQGQAMLNMTWVYDFGHIEGYILPGFRKRNFPGPKGRLRSSYEISDEVRYQSDNKDEHIDYALRLYNLFGNAEIGWSYFKGTNREPELMPEFNGSNVILVPYYSQISQISIDFLYQSDQLAWKLEAFNRRGQGDDDFYALTGGFEYTSSGNWLKGADVNWFLEYMYDSRDELATTPFEHDVFAGIRIALNDLSGTEIRINSVVDIENSGVIYSAEFSRRITDEWRFSALARIYSNFSENDFIYDFRNDDYLELEVIRYF